MRLSCKPSPLGPPLGAARCFLPQVEASVFLRLRRQAARSPLLSSPLLLRMQQLRSQSSEMEKVRCLFQHC